MIAAVLVVPADSDPGGLLAPDAPGTNPRMARRLELGALVLWWDGDLAPGGWDRALRAHHPRTGPKWWAFIDAWKNDAWRRPRIDRILDLAASLVDVGLASRVVRLSGVTEYDPEAGDVVPLAPPAVRA